MQLLRKFPFRLTGQTSLLARLIDFLAGTAFLASAFILVAWFSSPHFIGATLGVKPNTALALVALFLVAGLSERGHVPIRWISLLPAGLSLTSLLHQTGAFSWSLGPLFGIHPGMQAAFDPPSAMSVGASFACLLASLAYGPLLPAWSRHRSLALALVGSILSALAVAALLGHGLNLPAVQAWGGVGGLNTGTALLVGTLGTIALLQAWQRHRRTAPNIPAWMPFPAMLAGISVTLVLWTGLREREQVYLASSSQAVMTGLAAGINLEIERQAANLERVARRWTQLDGDALVVREADAVTHFNDAPGAQSIAWIAPAGRTLWFYPSSGNEGLLAYDQSTEPARLVAMHRASEAALPVVSATLPVRDLGPGFAIYAPVFVGGELSGYVVGDYAYERFFEALDRRLRLNGQHHFSAEIGGRLLYTSFPPGKLERSSHLVSFSFVVHDRRVRLTVGPSEPTLVQNRRHLPELALAAGFGITLLLGLTVHLTRTSRFGQLAAEESARRLQAENEERRRVENRLIVADERLRLSLDATQIGIFEWFPDDDRLYVGAGFWQLLGFDSDTVRSTFDFWLTLVHSDERSYVAETMRSLILSGEDFAEPEYRVVDREGRHHWLYARARVVTRSENSGRALRIVGTLQDITARRLADQALRESQATTRKLSLVASRTDNLVVIATADGTIEWINQSVQRVLGPTLADIAGIPVTRLLTPPQATQADRAEIESAIRLGQVIDRDLTLPGKDGLLLNLHLELQPARDEQGRVQNFIAILTDITARIQTLAQLRRAKAEADAASTAKSDFLASMSHEIRTPMNGVIGMTSLLLDTTLDEEQREFVETIRTSGDALLGIINDILDFSKIEAGRLELETHPFELSVCIEEVLDLYIGQAAPRRLELAYHLDPSLPAWIIGDAARIRQVLVNLVNNAVKFTPSGSVTIEVGPAPLQPSLLQFSVVDTGIGINPDGLARLFRPFSQVDSSTTRRYGGTGLGLAICDRLVRLMGGRIQVASTLGQGSSFTFTLAVVPAGDDYLTQSSPELPALCLTAPVLVLDPLEVNRKRLAAFLLAHGGSCLLAATPAEALPLLAAHPLSLLIADISALAEIDLAQTLGQNPRPILWLQPPAGGAPTEELPGDPSQIVTKPIKSLQLVRALHQISESGQGRAPRALHPSYPRLADSIPLDILIVEDTPVNQKVALRFLQRLGYRADAVANGLEALNTLSTRSYDLVFMDLHMPEMDGMEATRQIRRRLPAERHPTIVALTANVQSRTREECLAAGMDDYLTKPIKLAELIGAIQRHFTPTTPPPPPTPQPLRPPPPPTT